MVLDVEMELKDLNFLLHRYCSLRLEHLISLK